MLNRDGLWKKAISVSVLIGLSALCALIWCFGFDLNWIERLRYPLTLSGDGLFTVAFIQSMIDGDWLPFFGIKSSRLAAPFGFNLADFPSTDGVFHFLFWLVSRFSKDPMWVLDFTYLLSFPLCALTMYWLLRWNSVSRFLSVFLSLLFALLPFHFTRHDHIYYALYFNVPLACGYLIQLWKRASDKSRPVFSWQDVLFLFFFAGCGFYQSYFLIFSLFLIFICWFERGKNSSERLIQVCGFPLVCLLAFLIIHLLPTWLFWFKFGGNTGLSSRHSGDVERYALKLINLFLPPNDSFIRPLGWASSRYTSGTEIVEGFKETMGLFGFGGLTVLMVKFLRGGQNKSQVTYFLGLMVIGMVLFTTIGGFGSIVAKFGFSRFRSLNRISVWIICLTYLFIGLHLEEFLRRGRSWRTRVCLSLLLAFALLELAPSQGRFSSLAGLSSFTSDQDFFAAVESKLPRGASVLQLPFAPFPEIGPIYGMSDYEHLRGIVFTKELKFSYGVFKGRPELDQIRSLSEPLLNIEKVKALGFSAIYIDVAGFPDGAFELTTQMSISNIFREKIQSKDLRRVAFIF